LSFHILLDSRTLTFLMTIYSPVYLNLREFKYVVREDYMYFSLFFIIIFFRQVYSHKKVVQVTHHFCLGTEVLEVTWVALIGEL
jgi:hypothetical protein